MIALAPAAGPSNKKAHHLVEGVGRANYPYRIFHVRRCDHANQANQDARPNTPEGDTLDILVTLVEAWEEKHCPIDPPDPIGAIRFAMEQHGLSRRDLEPLIGSRARVAEVLNHKRRLTLPMIRRLHSKVGIPAEVLINEPGSHRAA